MPGRLRARPIPMEIHRTKDGGLSLSTEANAIGVRPAPDDAAWSDCPEGRTCVRVQFANDAPRAKVIQVLAEGEIFLTHAGQSELSVGSAGPRAYQIVVRALPDPVLLSLRLTKAPRIVLEDGYAEISKGLGARNKGAFDGAMTFVGNDAGRYLQLELQWGGNRLFGWVGRKTRTLRIPTHALLSARWTRQATKRGDRVVVGDAHLIELSWKIPPRGRSRRYSTASARLIARIPPASRDALGVFDFLLQRRGGTITHDCCYPDSSLSAYLRFSREKGGGDRCDTSRRCTKDEREWFAR